MSIQGAAAGDPSAPLLPPPEAAPSDQDDSGRRKLLKATAVCFLFMGAEVTTFRDTLGTIHNISESDCLSKVPPVSFAAGGIPFDSMNSTFRRTCRSWGRR